MSSTIQFSNNLIKEIKELPHNIEAEQGLLGAILLNNDITDDVSSLIDASHFYEEIHKRIYAVINRLIAKGQLARHLCPQNQMNLREHFLTLFS